MALKDDNDEAQCLHPNQGCELPAQFAALTQKNNLLNEELTLLRQLVITDPLTQLFNKRHFEATLEHEMERSRRTFLATGLILLDIDHFKLINDQYGHPVGDEALIQTANQVRKDIRKIDIPCRNGGEEFAIILPSTPLLTAIHVAERLRISLSTMLVVHAKGHLQLTASFGVVSFQAHHNTTTKDLIERADQLLYKAKNSGRNQVCGEMLSQSNALNSDERAALFFVDHEDPLNQNQ